MVDFYFFELPTYTYAILLGAAGALVVAEAYARPRGTAGTLFWTAALVATLGGLIGARLYHVALHADYYAINPDEALNFAQGGLAWRGGLVGGLAALALFAWLARARGAFFRLADAAAVGVPLALGIGWLGAHAAGLQYGAVSDSPIALELPDAFGIYDLRFPVQLASGALDLLLFAFLVWLARYRSRRIESNGRLLAVFLVVSSIVGGLLEFWRGDALAVWHGFYVDQWVDLVLMVIGLLLWIRHGRLISVPLRSADLVRVR